MSATTLWGYAGTASISPTRTLIRENYRGIRPAPGYPACPDHSLKPILFDMLGGEPAPGITLTESFAMLPTSAVSGFYFGHPRQPVFRRRADRPRPARGLCRAARRRSSSRRSAGCGRTWIEPLVRTGPPPSRSGSRRLLTPFRPRLTTAAEGHFRAHEPALPRPAWRRLRRRRGHAAARPDRAAAPFTIQESGETLRQSRRRGRRDRRRQRHDHDRARHLPDVRGAECGPRSPMSPASPAP